MSHIIEKYDILNELSEEFKKNIKILYIFIEGKNVLIVTKDDSVYAFGENKFGVLGFGHDNTIKDPTLVMKLCNKNINNFTNGLRHVSALTSDGKVYIWGIKLLSRFVNGKTYKPNNEPKLYTYLSDKFIVDICCNDNYSLALTKSGDVYVFSSQIDKLMHSEPIKVNLFNQKILSLITGMKKAKFISWNGIHSVVVTESGQVCSLHLDISIESFLNIQLKGILSSRQIKAKDEKGKDLEIDKIKLCSRHCLILTSGGDIYFFNEMIDKIYNSDGISFETFPKKINEHNKFIDIAVYSDSYVALSTQGYYYLLDKSKEKLEKSFFKSFIDVFALKYGITYSPIRFDKYLNIENVSMNTLNDGKFEQEFHEFGLIASGSYGIVCRAMNISDGEIYAIKKIPFDRKSDLRILEEIKIVNNLSKPYFVKCFNAWFEKLTFDKCEEYIKRGVNIRNIRDSTDFLFIQMELCFHTLRQFSKKINDELNENQNDLLTPIGYFISSELFREILESINYLHQQKPPIIHRDLKPTNILITNGMKGRFVKIADFGLATIHEFDEQSHTRGVEAMKYLAPEVLTGNYDTKADVYSLGVIAEELFNINKKSAVSECDSLLRDKYRQLIKLINRMKSLHKENRLNFEEIINEMSDWYLGLEIIHNQIDIKTKPFESSESLHQFFIYSKRIYN